MFAINNIGDLVFYIIFYAFLPVAIYQFMQLRIFRRFIGLTIITIIIAFYTVIGVFFPHSSFVPPYSVIPPIGLVGSIYYLTYSKKRNPFIMGLSIFFVIVLVGAYILFLLKLSLPI